MTDNFKLLDLLNSRSKQREEVEEEQQDGEGDFNIIDIESLVPSKENFYSQYNKKKMKASIQLLGVEQPLRVEPIEGQPGKYKVLAGHCRLSALRELVEEDEKYRQIPCYIKSKKSEQLSYLTILLTNFTQRDPTDYEKMVELTEIEKEVDKLKKQEDLPGRARDIMAELMSISSSQIGRYHAIRNNLNDHLMESFRNQEIGMSIAYEASGLSQANQIKLYALLREKDKIELPDIKAIKRMEDDKNTTSDNENTALDGAINEPEEPEQLVSEPEGPRPEGEDSTEKPHTQGDHEEKAGSDREERKTSEKTEPKQPERQQDTKREQPANRNPAEMGRVEKGCGFCMPQNHREISTMEGGTLINLDPEKKQLQILHKETGVAESVAIVACPLCGRIL